LKEVHEEMATGVNLMQKITPETGMPEIMGPDFEPKKVYEEFMKITTLSHPSGDENPLRNYIISFAKDHKLKIAFFEADAKDPGKRVIVLLREGSGKFKGLPFVTLQAHTDMVCYSDQHIFPLNVFGYKYPGEEKWIKAGRVESIENPEAGTTLGADDGIGVATILAILEDEKLKDYPIECFFTVQEETDMGGAKGFDPSILIGKKYINLDAEVLRTIIFGSAGGCSVQFEGKIERSSLSPEKYATLKVELSGLQSGHSGVNINNGRLNAIKTLADVLCRLNNRLNNLDPKGSGIYSYDLRLVSIKRDEKAIMNKIPSKAYAEIAVLREDVIGFVDDFKAYCECMKVENQSSEKNLAYEVIVLNGDTTEALNEGSTDSILRFLSLIPHGPIRMIPTNPTLVETSTNLADIEIVNNKVVIRSSNRSSNDASMKSLTELQDKTGNIFGFKASFNDPYPSWQPKEDSELLRMAEEVYSKLYGKDYQATVIHAGLECSYIVKKFGKDKECISIGPTIENPHTGGERLQASTVKSFYESVARLLNKIFES
jgi:dipeptidase D